ncbi:hypothetical protein Tco_1144741 [Tanacetum coccineum]
MPTKNRKIFNCNMSSNLSWSVEAISKTEWLESVVGLLRMSKEGGKVTLLLKLFPNLAVMDVTILVSNGKTAIKFN